MDSHVFSSHRQQYGFLIIVLLTSIFGGILSHNIISLFDSRHHATSWAAASTRLEARDDLVERGLGDFLSNLGSETLGSIESGISSLLPNVTSALSSLFGGANSSSILDSLAEPALFLGSGLASGALTGLNMSGPANTTTPSGVDGITQNLGSGLTSTLFSSSAIKGLFQMNTSSLGSSGTVGQAVLALAQGLGGGAASGLNLTTTSKTVADTTTMFNTSGINGVAGNFGQGLSSSLLAGLSLSSLTSLVSSGSTGIGSANSTFNIAAIGAGLGAGLGQGAAIGLGFQNDTGTSATQDPAGITQDFAKGLVSSFLQNGTLSKVATLFSSSNSSSSSLSLSSIDVAKVAEGLAVGLISGVGSTISTLQVIGADTTSFNDSVGGAATGFGRGVGSEGAKLVSQILSGTNSSTTTQKRNLNAVAMSSDGLQITALARRETTSINATDLGSIISSLNASTINPLLQTGIDSLTCEGVGGLVGVLFGLIQSKTIDPSTFTSSPSTTNTSLNLPDQVFIIKSSGNTYSLNPAKGIMTVLINGMGIGKFAGVAATHILFALVAYFVVIPALLFLHSGRKISFLLNSRNMTPPAPSRCEIWISYSILPLAFLTIALGVAFGSGKTHFSSAHEILGLIVFLQTLIAAVTTILLKRQNLELGSAEKLKLAHYVNIGLMLFLTILTFLFGFTDLSSISLCVLQSIIPASVWIAIGWLLLTPFMLAISLALLVMFLERKRRNRSPIVGKEEIVKVKGGEIQTSYMNV